jgi:hypothetical protein
MPAGFINTILQWSPALDQLNDQHRNRNHEQDVNKIAEHMKPDKSEKPEDEQNNEDCPEHKISFRLSHTSFARDSSVALIGSRNFLQGFPITATFWSAAVLCRFRFARSQKESSSHYVLRVKDNFLPFSNQTRSQSAGAPPHSKTPAH